MNIVESLIKNNRQVGALSYLLNPKYVKECDDLSQLCAQLIDVKNYVESDSPAYKNIVSNKINLVFNDTVKHLSGPDIKKLTYQLLDKSVDIKCLKEFFESVLKVKPKVFGDKYLVSIVKVTMGETLNAQDYEPFDINQLRNLAELAEAAGSLNAAQVVGELIVERAQNPFWEYHFVALQHSRLGNIEYAFDNYKLFLDEAINKGVNGAIKTGYLRVIECCQQLNKSKDDIDTLGERIPKEIKKAGEVVNALRALEDIEQFRDNLINNGKKSKVIGYFPLKSLEKLEKEVNRYLELIKVCPSYESFYELYKCYSVLGDEANALKYLELAQDFNYFLFNQYN